MNKEQRKAEFLRKLIDLPRPIVTDLQKQARESGRSLKSYIEELIVSNVRNKTGHGEDESNGQGNHSFHPASFQ